jgi:hypothetical protein
MLAGVTIYPFRFLVFRALQIALHINIDNAENAPKGGMTQLNLHHTCPTSLSTFTNNESTCTSRSWSEPEFSMT